MKRIDIDEVENLKDTLDELEDSEFLYLSEDGVEKYLVIPTKLLEQMNSYMSSFEDGHGAVQIISPNPVNLTYDEYEAIKKQLNKVLDETFKPNPEKLN